jgi:outer membrane protein OmpA-like peptidoglycan-associated protein
MCLFIKKYFLIIIIISSISSCATNNIDVAQYNNYKTNNSVAGITTAALITVASGGTGGALFINTIIGGFAGNYIGEYMDNKNKSIEPIKNLNSIIHIEQKIKLTFPSDITFSVDNYNINNDFKEILIEFSKSLINLNNYQIKIIGHTDNTGDSNYNLKLSLKRASAIKDFLVENGISPKYISTVGKGELEPTETNDTEVGRNKNRRVEIKLNIVE